MTFIINIYKKDGRTKSKRKIIGSYEFKDRESLESNLKDFRFHCKKENGYTIEIIEE